MSKGLEALERLYCAGRLDLPYVDSDKHKEDYELIEKELKALEIIRETPEFAWYVTIYKNAYEMVSDVKGFRINNSVEELQKMFDLLKEVLL